MVESVEEFRGEGHGGSFRNSRLLGNTQVHIPQLQSSKRAATRSRVRAQLGGPELVKYTLRIAEYVQTGP